MPQFLPRFGNSTKLGLAAFFVAAMPVASALAVAADAPAEALTAEQVEQGRQLFNDNACNSCHVLADANANGTIGPAFDGNGALNQAGAANVIANGQGAMPSFGWLAAEEIDLLAAYIVQTKK